MPYVIPFLIFYTDSSKKLVKACENLILKSRVIEGDVYLAYRSRPIDGYTRTEYCLHITAGCARDAKEICMIFGIAYGEDEYSYYHTLD